MVTGTMQRYAERVVVRPALRLQLDGAAAQLDRLIGVAELQIRTGAEEPREILMQRGVLGTVFHSFAPLLHRFGRPAGGCQQAGQTLV